MYTRLLLPRKYRLPAYTLLIRKMTDKDFVVTDAFVVFLDSSHAGMEASGRLGKIGCTKTVCF